MLTDLVAQLQAALGDAFSLDRELTGGGMSRLFLATERSLNRTVVIKVLPPELTSTVSVARFKREIEVAAHLQHPHIVPVLGAGAGSGLLYYIMPFVQGDSLRHRLTKEGKLPVADALRILREVADALAYAHRRGVVHRDIKPENILIEEGHAVLTDFGIARAILEAGGSEKITGTGMSVGTPGYMAPEQVSGEEHIDARTDVYALAVVGYEMFAGAPPFTGANAGAVMAAHLRDAPPPLEKRRPDAPASAVRAIARALSKSPDARFQTAAEFRDAIAAESSQGNSKRTRIIVAAAVAAAAAAAAVVGVSARLGGERGLDDNRLAVAPFDVLAPTLSLWKEGMVDVLSRNLDGMGPLRTVSPSVVVGKWAGRSDAASAQALGKALGARLVVFGSLESVAGDSVRATATLLDASNGKRVGEIEVRDHASRIDRLTDSVTVRLLRELARSRPIGAARLASVGSRSLPALREFLQGEQAFRRTSWDSAAAHYQRALTLDSTFALAYSRLGNTAGWSVNFLDAQGRQFKLKAASFNRGLSPRDSTLIVADSLYAALSMPYGDSTAVAGAIRLVRMLEGATAVYPQDPQVWYALGDARFHFGHVRGVDAGAREMLESFDRAIAADSSFAPPYLHAMEVAGELGGPAFMRRYATALLKLDPEGTYAASTRINLLFADTSRVSDAQLVALLDTAPANGLGRAFRDSYFWGDSSETLLRFVRMADTSRALDRKDAIWPRVANEWVLAWMQQLHGHVREMRVKGREQTLPFVLASARVGRTDPDSARTMALRLAADTSKPLTAGPPGSPLLDAVVYFAERRDTAAVRLVAEGVMKRLRSTDGSIVIAPGLRQMLAAFSALARGDSVAAIRLFETAAPVQCAVCTRSFNLTQARLLSARGRNADALRLLRPRGHSRPGMEFVLWSLARASAAEAEGERETAITEYARVLDLFRRADPELQPVVAEARAGLARLGGNDARRRIVAR